MSLYVRRKVNNESIKGALWLLRCKCQYFCLAHYYGVYSNSVLNMAELLCQYVSILDLDYLERANQSRVHSQCFNGRLWGHTLLFDLPYSAVQRLSKAVLVWCWFIETGGEGLRCELRQWQLKRSTGRSLCRMLRGLKSEIFWPVVSGCSWTVIIQVRICREEELWCNTCFEQASFWTERKK